MSLLTWRAERQRDLDVPAGAAGRLGWSGWRKSLGGAAVRAAGSETQRSKNGGFRERKTVTSLWHEPGYGSSETVTGIGNSHGWWI